MKLLAFAVFDDKAEAYMPPFFVAAPGQAIRLFTDECKNSESPVGKHPADYRLYRIGSYDDAGGVLAGEQPVLMMSGAESQTLAVAR